MHSKNRSQMLKTNSLSKSIIYARVSSKEQEREGYSIEPQLRLLRDYAHAQGFEIVRVYQEVESAKRDGSKLFNERLGLHNVEPQNTKDKGLDYEDS